MSKKMAYDDYGFISCKCKTPFTKSSYERTSLGSNKKLSKTSIKKYGGGTHAHNYIVQKGTKLAIGTSLNQCKCTLFSGKARDSNFRKNRKDPSYIRTRKLAGINHLSVDFN